MDFKDIYSRFSPTDNVGMSLLNFRISKDLGWIARDVRISDVGIDCNVEQVIDGNPTARYISIQLKTGLGNVDIDRDGNYVFRFNEVHYTYWLNSSIPVIIAICDPDKETIAWSLLKNQNISKTKKNYKITIEKDHIIGKTTVEEFNSIIDAYVPVFIAPDFEDMDSDSFLEYWQGLINESTDSINAISGMFIDLSTYCIDKTTKLLNFLSSSNCRYVNLDSLISKGKSFSKSIAMKMDIERSKILTQLPIATKTYILGIRSLDSLVSMTGEFSPIVAPFIYTSFKTLLEVMEALIVKMEADVETIEIQPINDSKLKTSIKSFILVMKEYISSLKEMRNWTDISVSGLKDKYDISDNSYETIDIEDFIDDL